MPTVVVGVDGSAGSLDAVALAAQEATLRHRPLHIVHAFVWFYQGLPLEPPEGGLRNDAQRVVDEAIALVRRTAPAVMVTGEVIVGEPAGVLIDQSRSAAVVVVGSRGLGGFAGLLVGSVAVQLAAHAHCPILVTRGSSTASGDVLIGIDGSPANAPAVGFAFEEAALHGAALTALHAWTHPIPAGPGDMPPLVYEAAEIAAEESRILAEALAGWRDKYPDVIVHRELRHEAARPALIQATGRARLVVVGSRGLGGINGLLLGSVSQALLHHATCPVAVVR